MGVHKGTTGRLHVLARGRGRQQFGRFCANGIAVQAQGCTSLQHVGIQVWELVGVRSKHHGAACGQGFKRVVTANIGPRATHQAQLGHGVALRQLTDGVEQRDLGVFGHWVHQTASGQGLTQDQSAIDQALCHRIKPGGVARGQNQQCIGVL